MKRRIKNRFPELDAQSRGLEYYGFDGKKISLGQWVSMTEDQIQAVASTFVRGQGRTYWVSTVLLGINYDFTRQGRPLIFETMIFESGPFGIREIMKRYHTIQQARKGHREVVRGMRAMLTERRRTYGPIIHKGKKP